MIQEAYQFELWAVDGVRVDELLHIRLAPGWQRRVTAVGDAGQLVEGRKRLPPCGLVDRPPGFVPVVPHIAQPTKNPSHPRIALPFPATSRRQNHFPVQRNYSYNFGAILVNFASTEFADL